jgi:hypothetical protein
MTAQFFLSRLYLTIVAEVKRLTPTEPTRPDIKFDASRRVSPDARVLVVHMQKINPQQ